MRGTQPAVCCQRRAMQSFSWDAWQQETSGGLGRPSTANGTQCSQSSRQDTVGPQTLKHMTCQGSTAVHAHPGAGPRSHLQSLQMTPCNCSW